jgi:hypothetical protein
VTNHSRSGQSFAFQLGKRFVDIFLVAATNDNVSSIDGQTLGHGEPNSIFKTTIKSISIQTAPFRLLAVFSPTYWDRAYLFKDEVLWDEIRRKQGNVSAFSGFMLGQCRFLIRCFWVYLWEFVRLFDELFWFFR